MDSQGPGSSCPLPTKTRALQMCACGRKCFSNLEFGPHTPSPWVRSGLLLPCDGQGLVCWGQTRVLHHHHHHHHRHHHHHHDPGCPQGASIEGTRRDAGDFVTRTETKRKPEAVFHQNKVDSKTGAWGKKSSHNGYVSCFLFLWRMNSSHPQRKRTCREALFLPKFKGRCRRGENSRCGRGGATANFNQENVTYTFGSARSGYKLAVPCRRSPRGLGQLADADLRVPA